MFSIPVPKGKACRPRNVHELKIAFRKAQECYEEESKPLVSIIGQIRSIEKDLKESNVNTAFTREVYECHIRLALEDGNVHDFAVTMNELEKLYETEGSTDELEMLSYAILYFILYDSKQDVERILEKASFFIKSDLCFDFAKIFANKWLEGIPVDQILKESENIELPGHLQYAIQWFTNSEVLGIVAEAKKREANRKLAQQRLEAAKMKKFRGIAKNSDDDSKPEKLAQKNRSRWKEESCQDDRSPPPKKKYFPELKGSTHSHRGPRQDKNHHSEPSGSGLRNNDDHYRDHKNDYNRGRRDDYDHSKRGDYSRDYKYEYDGSEKYSRKHYGDDDDPYGKPAGYYRSSNDPYEAYQKKDSGEDNAHSRRTTVSSSSLWDRR